MHLELTRLTVQYPGAGRPAVAEVSFGLPRGGIGVLIGPSGCGKTTLLRAIAGLERASGGVLRIDGQVVGGEGRHLPPEQRRIGMVFQDYALFPHLDVGRNVAFGIDGLPRAERAARVLLDERHQSSGDLGRPDDEGAQDGHLNRQTCAGWRRTRRCPQSSRT